jgi:PIN domain nuclease of toxin-antitoxin system
VNTHLLLLAAGKPKKHSKKAQHLLKTANSLVWFSAASPWEITFKLRLGRGDFRFDPRQLRRGLIENGWRELVITSEHCVATLNLPPIHKDPFDKMLIVQAYVEGHSLVTSDDIVAKYPGTILKV